MCDLSQKVDEQGFALVPNLIGQVTIDTLCSVLENAIPQDKRAGTRRLLDIPEIQSLAKSDPVLGLMQSFLGSGTKPVREILFDKQPGANWDLGYHQDRAIAIKSRIDTEGFIGWSEKEGVPHVLPPASVLEQMLTIRIHLDDCGHDNAPLRVSPTTHTLGLIEKLDVHSIVEEHGEVTCTCKAGDALLMRPLLHHASSASESPSHRRVVHIEYTGSSLPNGLEWYE